MIKRIAALLLCLSIVLSVTALSVGATGADSQNTEYADYLNLLHLFQGTENGYELDKAPDRIQALVMFLRLLGLEDEALAYTGTSPFTDLTWGKEYVAYAYAKGLTSGVTDTTFEPHKALDAKTYITFLLRGLGYDDSKGDFNWATAVEFAAGLGVIDEESAETLKTVKLNRGDMVALSYVALTHSMKNGSGSLAQSLCNKGVFSSSEGKDAHVLGEPCACFHYDKGTGGKDADKDKDKNKKTDAVSYTQTTIATSEGKAGVHVIRVDTSDPAVTVKSQMVDNTLGATEPFKEIVKKAKPLAAINGNFFESFEEFKIPIGYVMVDSEMLYCNAGLHSLGIAGDGSLCIGQPSVFTRIRTADRTASWSAYNMNIIPQGDWSCVMYTPAYGKTVTATINGDVVVVKNNRIQSYEPVSAGEVLDIPANGYLLIMGKEYTSTHYFTVPTPGTQLQAEWEYYLRVADAEGFTLDNAVSIVTGAPRLVRDSKIVTELDAGFTEERFTTISTSRTAIGIDGDGLLVLACVPRATIQQMREIMLALGCVDAFNLDGGASCGMYYDGEFISTPQRDLTTTLHIFVD